MEIDKNILAFDSFLFLKKEKTLVVGDLHLGYEEALNKDGIFIPRFQFKELMDVLSNAVLELNPKNIILLGDIKHEFGSISSQEWKNTLFLLDYLSSKAKVVILEGNHDVVLQSIVKKKNIVLSDYFFMEKEKYFFCHGDKLFEKNPDFKKSKFVFIGHEHPAVAIKDNLRSEKYKCFLVGKIGLKKLFVLPSSNPLVEGSDILASRKLSPFLKKNIDAFKVFVVGDKIYDFGSIKKLKKL